MTLDTNRIIHDISAVAIMKTIAVVAFFLLLYYLRDVLLVFFVALLLAALIAPLAEKLEKRKVPRSVTVIGVYVFIVAALFLVVASVVQPILEELRDFVGGFSAAWSFLLSKAGAISAYTSERGFTESWTRSLDSVTGEIPRFALGAFLSVGAAIQSVFSLVVIFVLAFYLVVEAESLKRAIKALTPIRYEEFVVNSLFKIQGKLGDWLRAQFLLSGAVAVLLYIGLILIGMPYALVLALLAGLLEMIPYAGPVVSAVPGVLLALSISPLKAVLAVMVYVAVQQLENHVLVPKVTQKLVGLNPIISILALLLGAKLAGFLGIVVAIPIVASAMIFVEDYFVSRERAAESV